MRNYTPAPRCAYFPGTSGSHKKVNFVSVISAIFAAHKKEPWSGKEHGGKRANIKKNRLRNQVATGLHGCKKVE